MKSTDFYNILRYIHRHEEAELWSAIEAHGGRYVFDEDNRPIVLASQLFFETYYDYFVTEVSIEDNKYISVRGYMKDGGLADYAGEIDQILPGFISYIIDKIPATESVNNVTIPFKYDEEAIFRSES